MQFKPNRQFYRVASGPCWDVLMAWRKEREAVDAACFDFAKSVGGSSFYAGHDDNVCNATALSAVTFEGDLPKGWKARRWSSFVVKDGQTPAWPDKRTKVGREALAAIGRLKLRPSSYKACDAIGFPSCINYKGNGTIDGYDSMMCVETMAVGWHLDTFYVGLPRLNDEIEKYEARGYTVTTPRWEPLEGMEPILKEEMDLDMARAKLEREREAA